MASLLLVPHRSVAQKRAEVTAAGVAQTLRTKGHAGQAVRTLRQQDGPVDHATLAAIADSLTEIAIHFPGDSIRAARTRGYARSALLEAGVTGRGVAFSGSAERLLRIALEANSGGALWSLTRLPNKRECLDMMRQVAVSSHRLAHAAVGNLGRDMGQEGIAIARDLFIGDLVKEPSAVLELNSLAAYFKWRR